MGGKNKNLVRWIGLGIVIAGGILGLHRAWVLMGATVPAMAEEVGEIDKRVDVVERDTELVKKDIEYIQKDISKIEKGQTEQMALLRKIDGRWPE